MDLFKLLGTIAIDSADAIKELLKAQQEGEKTESKLSKTFSAIGNGAAVCGKAIGAGLLAGATAMAGLTTKALQLSGDLEQNMGGAETVFKDLGGSIKEMSTTIITGYDEATGKAITATTDLETVSKNAYKNMGLSQSDYLATANKMGALFKGAGFETQEALDLSSQAMQRAADVASIMGIDTEAAMEAVAGAAKGNFTMMDNLGVAMNDTAIGAYALEKGIKKSTTEMSQQEKIGLAMEMFMEKTAYAAGNYAKENETLAGSLGTAKSALTNFLAGSGDVDSLVSSFSNLANVVVKSLTEIAPRLTTGLSELVQKVAPLIPPLLNSLLPVLVEGAVTLVNGLVQALPGILTAILDVLPMLIEGIMQIADALVGALPQIIEALVAALPTLIPQLIDGVVSLILMLVEMLPQIIQPIIDYLPEIIASIVTAVLNNLPALIQGAIQLVGALVSALPQIFMALVQAIPLIFQGIWESIKNVFAPVGEWFGEKFNSAKESAANAWSDTKKKWNDIKEKCVEGFSNLKDKIGTKFSEAKENAQKKWSDAKDKFNTVKDKVVSAFSNLGSKLSPLFSKAKDNATQTWSGVKPAFEKFKNGDIVGAFSDLGSLLKGKFSTALDSAKKGFSKIKQIGKDLISGLWNGISDKFSWLTGKIKGFANDVTDKIKGFFGIKSPSRVFRDEVGKQLADGVAVGITANSKNAESAAEKMGKNILDAAQSKLDNYKTYNDLTLADEAAFWQSVAAQCAEGTQARIDADKKYLDAKRSLDEQFKAAEEELQNALAETQKKIEERTQAILNARSLTETFSFEHIDSNSLFTNLNSQISAMKIYEESIDSLEAKIGGTAIFERLSSLGVDSLNEIRAFASMTEIQLKMYSDRYDTMVEMAKNFAEDELADETLSETQKAYQTFADKCDELGVAVVEDAAAMKSGVEESFTAITMSVSTATESISVNVGEKMLNAVDTVKNALTDMKTAFETFQPRMKMPHFKIKGELDLEEGTVPTVSVEWYKKAMGNAMLLNKPTIFGYNASTGNLMGGGEAGSEVVAGSQTLMNMIQNAVAEQNTGLVAVLSKILKAIVAMDSNMGGNMRKALENTALELNKREFARIVKAVN